MAALSRAARSPAQHLASRPAARSPAPGTAPRTHRRKPDCRAGPAPAGRPPVPNISGLPGRMAIFQKSSVEAACRQARLHQIMVADAGAAGGHQQIRAARRIRPRGDRRRIVARDRQHHRLAARGRDQGGQAWRVGADDAARRRSPRRAARFRRRSPESRCAAGGTPSARDGCRRPPARYPAPISRLPAGISTSPAAKSCPARRICRPGARPPRSP